MRLRIDFGVNGARKEVGWYKSLDDFPHFFTYGGKKWEWAAYDRDFSGDIDYVLIYSEIPHFDPNYYTDMPSWESIFGIRTSNGCECGSIYTSFPQAHMFYCPMWRKI